MPIAFSVPGEPVPQPRPRVTTRGGFGRAYVPHAHPVHAYRASLAAAARDAGAEPHAEPVSVVIDLVFERPKSHMTNKGVKATAPRLPRPDVDNVGKAVLDALQPVIGDDTIVGRLVIAKRYSDAGMTSVTISEMSDE